jgi:hypothetical protein
MWQRNGEFNKAIVDFDRAVRMSFADPELYCDRGAAWFAGGSISAHGGHTGEWAELSDQLEVTGRRRVACSLSKTAREAGKWMGGLF